MRLGQGCLIIRREQSAFISVEMFNGSHAGDSVRINIALQAHSEEKYYKATTAELEKL